MHVVGNVAANGLNNIEVSYNRNADVNVHATKLYTAATFNNALYDFDGYADADGLNKTHNGLQIMIMKTGAGGATPMFNKLMMNGSGVALTINAFLTATLGGLPGIAPTSLGTFSVDVYFCYNMGGMEDFRSDQIKELAYHEYSHVIHYKKCGNFMWEANLQYVVNNSITSNNLPYGDLGDNGSGRCALIEMWAYYLGREYANRRYGSTRHSLDPSPQFNNSWYSVNESGIFEWDYIPAGFLQDLRDDNAYNQLHSLLEAFGITDNCSGFTNSMIYDKMGPTTNTAGGLIDKLDNSLPTGTTPADYDVLKANYGY